MVLTSFPVRTFRGQRKWAPAAVNLLRAQQKRHNTPYMPWPYDKYKRPGAAKYWLSKSPATDASQDEYEQELVYLDELESRIHNTQANYSPSEQWQSAYNEYAWQDDESVTATYGSIGGPTSEALRAKYGRGNKIDPSHYINPRFYKHDRVSILSPYIHPDLRKRLGPLKNLLSLPPEEPSAFKLWNPWTMAGGTSVILLSKEWFLISHDFWHATAFWGAWALICTVGADWWTWWYALRGQEWYDLTYFPLNEKTEQLFKMLEMLDNRPPVAGVAAALGPYLQELAQRTVDKQKASGIAEANITAQEKLEQKLKEESGAKGQALALFKERTFKASMDAYSTTDAQTKYMANALKLIKTGAELKPGVAEFKSSSKEFSTTYESLYKKTEQEYYDAKRKEGTLPWVLATDKEITSNKMTPADKQKRYADRVQTFAKKYHAVQLSKNFA